MTKIGIFFGSDTGNTEKIAKMINKILKEQFSDEISRVQDIAKSSQEDIEYFEVLVFGIPTWYYGEAQCDWDDFFPTLENVKFNGKQVALFGCGDQEDYGEYFCDAIGILHDIIKHRGANIIGNWPTKGYHFEASRNLMSNGKFIGLAIDEDRQPELTYERVSTWVMQIIKELNLCNNICS